MTVIKHDLVKSRDFHLTQKTRIVETQETKKTGCDAPQPAGADESDRDEHQDNEELTASDPIENLRNALDVIDPETKQL